MLSGCACVNKLELQAGMCRAESMYEFLKLKSSAYRCKLESLMPATVKTHYAGVAELIQLLACHHAEFRRSLSRGDHDARSENLTAYRATSFGKQAHVFSREVQA